MVVLARNEAKINALTEELRASGNAALGISADVLDIDALEKAAAQVMEHYGRVDILVNGAGGNRPEATATPGQRTFFDLDPEAMRWVFDLNFTGTLLATQVFGKHIAEQEAGVILNISSMASFQPDDARGGLRGG